MARRNLKMVFAQEYEYHKRKQILINDNLNLIEKWEKDAHRKIQDWGLKK